MDKPVVYLVLQQHKNADRIFLQFAYNPAINKQVKMIPGARYSGSEKAWHIPVVKALVLQLADRIKELAVMETGMLRKQLLQKKEGTAEMVVQRTAHLLPALSNANQRALELYLQALQLNAYSASTIKTYRYEFTAFLQLLKQTDACTLSAQKVKDYLQYCLCTLGLKENTLHSRMNALKFYYEKVLNREKFFWEIPRPKKPLLEPKVLNETELQRLFNAVPSLKHKALLFTAYSAGLRVSEAVNLRWKDIDRKRSQILIAQAKGKKDRYVSSEPCSC